MFRKNVASQNLPFALVNATTGAALTGATVTARRSLDGGAQASATGTVSELGNGQYNLALSQADTNGNQIGILLTATNAIPVHFTLVTTAADPTDSVRLGLTALPNAAAAASGGLPTVDASNAVKVQSGTGANQISLASGLVTVGTNNDKTGYRLSATGVDDVWDEARAGHTTSGTFGEGVASVQGNVTGSVGSVTGNVGGNVTGSVGSVAAGGITSGSFAAGAIDAAAIATDAIGSAELAASAVTEIQSGLATAAALTSLQTDVTSIQADTNDIQTRLPAALVSGRIDASVGAMAANVVTASAIATDALTNAELAASAVDEIVDAVWDELLAGHAVSGSTGEALSAAGAAGDPWATALPGAYGSGTAGNIVGNRLDAAVTSRLAPTVSGRTLDVTAGGEAGIDWANIGSPTTAQTLSGTSVGTATALGAQAKADVNAEVLDVLNTDTFTEISSIPAASTNLATMIRTLYAFVTNKLTQTSTTQTLRNRADNATIGTASVADDSVTANRGSFS